MLNHGPVSLSESVSQPMRETEPEPTLEEPRPRRALASIEAYQPGRTHEDQFQGGRLLNLSANESALGASPAVRERALSLSDVHCYPDDQALFLRRALSEHLGVRASQIIIGAGSNELLGLVARAYLEPGDETLYTRHGFLLYALVTQAAGARPIAVPEKNFKADVEALYRGVTAQTSTRASTRVRMLFLANPNNPTGTFLTQEELKTLLAHLPSDRLLVLDTAYREYVTEPSYGDGLALLETHPNLFITGTFSKIYGLAGLRIGWGVGSEKLIAALHKVRLPFNVSAWGQALAGVALRDQRHVANVRTHTETTRRKIVTRLTQQGLRCHPAVANFFMLELSSPEQAMQLDAHLRAHGILVRKLGAYGLSRFLRITVGTEEEMAVFENAALTFQAGLAGQRL